jgi:hypothetical protein
MTRIAWCGGCDQAAFATIHGDRTRLMNAAVRRRRWGLIALVAQRALQEQLYNTVCCNCKYSFFQERVRTRCKIPPPPPQNNEIALSTRSHADNAVHPDIPQRSNVHIQITAHWRRHRKPVLHSRALSWHDKYVPRALIARTRTSRERDYHQPGRRSQ